MEHAVNKHIKAKKMHYFLHLCSPPPPPPQIMQWSIAPQTRAHRDGKPPLTLSLVFCLRKGQARLSTMLTYQGGWRRWTPFSLAGKASYGQTDMPLWDFIWRFQYYTLVHGFCFFRLFPIGCIGFIRAL